MDSYQQPSCSYAPETGIEMADNDSITDHTAPLINNKHNNEEVIVDGETSFLTSDGAIVGASGSAEYKYFPDPTTKFHFSSGEDSVTVANGFHGLSSGGTAIEQVTLTWENIDVTVKTSEQKRHRLPFTRRKEPMTEKHILKDVSGVVKPGRLLAIMGASGAGKTTLLNVLTGRLGKELDFKGQVKVNGQDPKNNIASVSGYVQQHDLFIGILTVREHLWVQAMLNMEKRIDREERLRRIDDVIEELGLSKCADTKIGSPRGDRGLSGGEKKRLAFAAKVLVKPALLFCDEPTTGLDSYMAKTVVQSLKNMAIRGRTIVSTIHQPSSEVFTLFDEILLMSEGRTAFLGKRGDALKFFAKNGFECPTTFNPGDYYVHTLAIRPEEEAKYIDRSNQLCDAFRDSKYNERILAHTADINQTKEKCMFNADDAFAMRSPYKSTCWEQLRVLLWRSWITENRNPRNISGRYIPSLAICVLITLIYLRQNYDEVGAKNINGFLFLLQMDCAMSNLNAVLATISSEFSVFLREHQDGLYRTGTYYLSKIFAEMPHHILIPIIWVSASYFVVGLWPTAESFFICMVTGILVCLAATALGHLLACAIEDQSTIASSVGMITTPFMVFGGFFINAATVPVYFKWLEALSFFKYSNEILVVNQWRDVGNLTCSPGGLNSSSCIPDGAAVIESRGYAGANTSMNFVGLIALAIGFRVLAYLFLLKRSYKRV